MVKGDNLGIKRQREKISGKNVRTQKIFTNILQ
jgi:hypothetical protein